MLYSKGRARFSAAVLMTTLALLLPSAVEAGRQTITAERFKPIITSESTAIWPPSAGAGTLPGGTLLWAPLNLPVGATVRKLQTYTWATAAHVTSVRIGRAKVGAPLNTIGADTLMGVEVTAVNNPANPPTVTFTTLPLNPGLSDLTVRAGYRYYVIATIFNAGLIQAVRVFY